MLKNTIFVSECQGRIGEFRKERQEPAILKGEGGVEGIGKDVCALNTRSFIVFSCQISPKLPTEGERGGGGVGMGGWGGDGG